MLETVRPHRIRPVAVRRDPLQRVITQPRPRADQVRARNTCVAKLLKHSIRMIAPSPRSAAPSRRA